MALADLEYTPGLSVADRARDIRKSFHCIQRARRDSGAEVPQNLLEMLSSLAEKPIPAPSEENIPDLERLEAPQNTLCEEVRRSWERLSALESELVAELNIVKAKTAELEPSLDGCAARVCSLEGEQAHLKAAQVEED